MLRFLETDKNKKGRKIAMRKRSNSVGGRCDKVGWEPKMSKISVNFEISFKTSYVLGAIFTSNKVHGDSYKVIKRTL